MFQMQPITLQSWPHAILHLKIKSFFLSVEQMVHSDLKGKPVITGADRGVALGASEEAQAWGVTPGMSLMEAAHLCPNLIMLPSDHAAYQYYADRLLEIVQRFTFHIDCCELDEVFVDLSNDAEHGNQAKAKRIHETAVRELGFSIAAGFSLSRPLAKMASQCRKDGGFMAVPGPHIHHLLATVPVEEIPDITPDIVAILRKARCRNALDVAHLPRYRIETILGRAGIPFWSALRGESTGGLPAPLFTPTRTHVNGQYLS